LQAVPEPGCLVTLLALIGSTGGMFLKKRFK
jgi:hypothetical protein